jgi:transposase-like protein/predicted RNA-binding Zn-ribbon protein involved in translation (DUF1610 family)
MLKCPYCGSTHLWKNGHRKDGTQQYRCKSCLKTFYIPHSKKDKLFPFQYPTCPKCGKSMQIYKIRRGYVRFRCKSCGYKMNVNRYLPPQDMNFVPSHFFRFKVHPSLIALVLFLYLKRNLSYRAIRDALPCKVSHVAIYKWVVKFSSFFFNLDSAYSLSADETVLLFKQRRYYLWFLVDWNSKKIVAWHFSRYRDFSNALKLFKKLKSHPSLITTDGLPSYPHAIEELFGKDVHKRAHLGYNNAVESRYSLFKDFVRAKRGFKKFSNIFLYINGWVFMHNLYKDKEGDKYAILSDLMPFIILG